MIMMASWVYPSHSWSSIARGSLKLWGLRKPGMGVRRRYMGQIDKSGKQSVVTKLNDGPVLALTAPPVRKTYYRVNNGIYVQTYARILIRRRTGVPA